MTTTNINKNITGYAREERIKAIFGLIMSAKESTAQIWDDEGLIAVTSNTKATFEDATSVESCTLYFSSKKQPFLQINVHMDDGNLVINEWAFLTPKHFKTLVNLIKPALMEYDELETNI